MKSWFRQVVPDGYARATIHLEGTSPLLMACPDADRDGALYRAFSILSKKQGKSLDDEAKLRELEWELLLYLDDEIGPFLPGAMVKRCLIDAAGKFRRGATIKRSLVTIDYRIPLEYEGPRDQTNLWTKGYRYTTMVKNAGMNGGRVMRCRPMFKRWAVTVPIAFDPEEIDADTLALVVERSQRYGLGDYRPALGGSFGSFAARITFETPKRASRAGLARKPRNGHEEAGHEAFKARIMDPDDLVPA
jgi:hypothetical protein